MFTTKNIIRLGDTDTAGILFFPQLFRFAQATLEDFMTFKKCPISYVLNEAPYFFPIVHAEADYLSPLKIGDEITIQLNVENIGETSFTMGYTFFKGETLVAKAKIVHVAVDKTTFKKRSIPHEFLQRSDLAPT